METEQPVLKNARGEQFIGSEACQQCHKKIYDSFQFTAHLHTSEPVTEKSVHGSFVPGKNIVVFSSDKLVKMEKRNNQLFQVEYDKGVETLAKRMDIVTGSGRKGQTYINQDGPHLFQLPIAYFTKANKWSNSPGYPDRINFSRPITARCLECHSTFAKTLSEPFVEPAEMDAPHIIFGVNCEKCHGPGLNHVLFQRKNPGLKTSRFIVNPAKLTREQNLEFCSSCHGGGLKKIKPAFEFKIGDKLSDYYVVDDSRPDPQNIDVHGNQFALLRSSKCFIKTNTLACNSCHSPHQNEAGNLDLFSSRCLNCHGDFPNQIHCKLTAGIGTRLKEDCISCHMPLKESSIISVYLAKNKSPTAATVRSHYIALYPELSKKILSYLKSR